jgi:hypothetical protein
MSTSRTFTSLVGGAAGGVYQAGDKFGANSAEKVRNNEDIAAYLMGHLDLGGDERPILSASFVPVNGARVFSLNGSSVGGVTLEAVVYTYTTDASTSVQARIRNVTDSSNAVTGTSITATTVTEEVLTLTLAAGIKKYRLDVTGGDANNGVYCWGYMRLRVVPS